MRRGGIERERVVLVLNRKPYLDVKYKCTNLRILMMSFICKKKFSGQYFSLENLVLMNPNIF